MQDGKEFHLELDFNFILLIIQQLDYAYLVRVGVYYADVFGINSNL